MDKMFDLAAHPIVLASPRRLSRESAWVEHIPFAMLVVELVRPGLIVELGTHRGDSYCAFCQAVLELGLASRAFAVDTWQGEEHTGRYGPEVLAELRVHHDATYGHFSTLLQATFDQAAGQFAEGSIDLLHIDGFHTYEAVRHDFETWLPKLSPRAVVLFHDSNARHEDFGVWRLWAELAGRYPHFEFGHGHGLGVLSVGRDEPPALAAFRQAFAAEPWVETLFFELGRRLSLQRDLAAAEDRIGDREELLALIRDKDDDIAALQATAGDLRAALAAQEETHLAQRAEVERLAGELTGHVAELSRTRTELAARTGELEALRQRTGYRALERTVRTVDRLAPWSTRRRQFLLGGSGLVRVLAREGPTGVVRRLPQVRQWAPQVWGVARRPELLTPGPGLGPGATLEEEYRLWRQHNVPSAAELRSQIQQAKRLAYQPKISIVMPVHNVDPVWLREAVESVKVQTYGNWELCMVDDGSTNEETRKAFRRLKAHPRIVSARLPRSQGIAAASNRALALASGAFVGFLDHDDELKPNALFEVARALNADAGLDFIYTDEDKRELDGRLVDPFFKPDWSPELLLTVNYVTHFALYRKSLLDQLGGLRSGYDGSQDYDLALRVTETTERIAHIPLPLYTWRKVPGSAAATADAKPWAHQAGARALRDATGRRGQEADVLPGLWKGSHRVRFKVGTPSVAIIIPTRDRVELLRRAVESIQERSTYEHFELLVVDNASTDEETLEYLETVKGRVLRYPHPFNYARMMNVAASEARTDLLVFLNNDTEVITPGWLEAMLEYAQQPAIGAVGARLLYPDGRVQHEGIIMGLGHGTAGNVNHGDYFCLGRSVLNVSAVTAACLMTRAEVFQDVAGFEERLTVAFNDVDFGLRLWAKGYRVVYTPHAELYHHESASRGLLHPPADEEFFSSRWGPPGAIVDPYYNPNLDVDRPYRVKISG